MSTLDEEKKRKIAERRAAAAKAQQNLDKYGISATELTNKSSASPVSGSKPATTKQEYAKQANAAAQAIKGTSRVADSNDYRDWLAQPKVPSGYIKKNAGDNDMNVVQSMYRKEEVDPASMTLDQAMGFATRIVDDKERDSFLKLYRKSAGKAGSANYVEDLPTLDEMRAQLNAQKPGGIYQKAGKEYSKGVKEQFARDYKINQTMKALNGLHDVNGNAINANTADFATVVQGIRSIVDSDKRNAAIASLKELIKTEGSRFYGQTIDEKLLKSYLGSPDFTQDDYDDIVEEYANAFYPQDGYDEENAATYWGFYDEIETSGYSNDIKRQLRDKLDSSFKNSTGKDIPTRTESAEETVDEGETQEEEEPGLLKKVGDAVGGFVDGIVDSITRPYTEKPEEEQPGSTPRTLPSWMQMQQGEEPPAPPSGWLKNDGMPDMSSATRLASAGRSDSAPLIPRNEAEVYGPQQRFTTKSYIKDDADVVGAILKGRYGDLDKADTQTVDGFMQYKTVQQIIGTVVDSNAVAEVRANNRGAENVVRENYGMLGTTASLALEVLMGEEYPAELRNDGLLILMELGAKAERLAQNGMLGGDPELPLLERLLTTDPDALNELNAIYSARDELEKSRAELLEAENLETQKKLAEAREAVLKGEYSDEQLAMVQKYAPELTGAEMSVDKRRMELGGLFDDWDYGFFSKYTLDEEGYIQFADGTSRKADDYIRFQDTAVYRNLVSNGVIDDTDYRVALNTQMHNVIDEDTRTAMSLGLTLKEYYKRIGGMNEEGICQRAATRIAQQGGMITEEDMQNIAEYGDGVNALEWSSATVGKATVGLFADYADSLYVGMSEANVVRTAGRMQVEYQDEFGDLMGRYYYRRDLERLLDSGTLPEGMAVSLRRAMAESIDIYQVGIDPEALGGLRTSGSKARAIVKQLDRFMQENATEGQYEWYNLGAGAIRNLEQAAIAIGVGAVAGAAGATASVANSIGFVAGYSVPGWNAYYEDAVINKHLKGRSAAYIASAKSAIDYVFNKGTFSKIAGQFANVTGADSLIKKTAAELINSNPVNAIKTYVNTHAFVKSVVTFAGNIVSEFGDEIGEGAGNNYVDNALVPLFQKEENGEKVTSSDLLKAVMVIPSADILGAAADTAASAKEIMITSSLFALGGAYKAGVNTYKSTQAANDILTGKSTDIGAYVEAAQQDLQDDQFCAAVDAVAEQTREDEAVAVELMTDDGSDGLMEREREANEQADAHAEKKEAAAAGMQAAQETMTAVQEKVDNGTADDTDVQMLTNAQEAYVKDKTSFEEAEREELQKREEAKRLRAEKYRNAKTAAKTRLAQQDADIAANMVATMEQRKAQTEAAQLEQERSNVVALEAENFVNDRYSGASEEDQQTARDMYIESAKGKMDTAFDASDRMMRQLQKRFGVKFKIVDSLEVADSSTKAEGGYSAKSNTIYIPKGATQGEAIKRILLHEMTHFAEADQNSYADLEKALIDLIYKGDNDLLNKDIQSMMADRNAYLEASGRKDRLDEIGARREIVAEINSRILDGDEDLINRLCEESPSVAQRIWETIKNFIDKLRGVEAPELTDIQKIEAKFKKALDSSIAKRKAAAENYMPSTAHPESMQFSIAQLADATGLKLETTPGENIPYKLVDAAGREVTEITPEMIKKTPAGSLIQSAVDAGTIDTETASAQEKMFADLATMSAQYKDQAMIWELAGAQVFSAIKNNSDTQYSTTVDFGTICAKTQAIVDVMSETMLKLKRGLTREEVLDVYHATTGADLSVPCPVCYVFSRWMGVPSLLNNMAEYQKRFTGMNAEQITEYADGVLSKYASDNDNASKAIGKAKVRLEKQLETIARDMQRATAKGESIDALNEKAKKLEAEYADVEAYNWVTQVLCKQKKHGTQTVQMRDANGNLVLNDKYRPVPDEILFDLRRTGEFAEYEASWKYRTTRGAGMGKAILPYTGASLGDTVYGKQKRRSSADNAYMQQDTKAGARAIKNAVKRMMRQNLIGGQRFQSTSDYRPEWGLDYLMTFLEMQAVGAKGQLYTKVIEAVDMFATAGIEVNLSIMPKGDGWHKDKDGNKVLDFSSVTGIDFDQAYEKVRKYDNVQMILVGINDEHIKLALADDRIGFVIPWHASGNSKDVLTELVGAVGEKLNSGTDYTETQSDKPVENPTPQQKAAADVRMRLLTGKLRKGMSEADRAVINSNPYLKDLYRRFYVDKNEAETYGVFLSSKQAGQVFPYEYWDTSLTRDQADENGRRFAEYCESIGKQPRFPQFRDEPGYWKLLIDRSMYNNDGTYHHPSKIDATKVQIGDVANSVSVAKYGDRQKTAMATEAAIERIRSKIPAEEFDGMQMSVPSVGVDDRDADYFNNIEQHEDMDVYQASREIAPLQQNGNIDGDAVMNSIRTNPLVRNVAGHIVTACPDIDADVELTRDGVTHAYGTKVSKNKPTRVSPKDMLNARASLLLPELLQRAVEVNRSNKYNKKGRDYGHVLMSVYSEPDASGVDTEYAVRMVVEHNSDKGTYELVEYGVTGNLHAANAKKIPYPSVRLTAQNSGQPRGGSVSKYRVSDLIDDVKNEFDDTFSEDVYARRGMTRNNTKFASDLQFSLPSNDRLIREIESYRALQNQPEPEAEQAQEIPRQQQRPMGERQFTTKTLQESQAVPQWIKDTLYNNPNARFYEKDTNDEQIVRSMNRLQEEGYEAMRDRVLRGNADSADNVADANLILAMANRDGDVQTFLDVAARYAAEGTETAKTLQARKIFSRMTPTGMRVWAAGQMENKLSDFISKHQPMRRQADTRAKKVADSIKDKQGGDELLRLQAASEYTITDENNRWGVPINQKQQALIDHYKLNKVARPGDAYNRATLKQRMLEAILAEPNPENVTGQGLNLIQRLEYAMEGAPVIFNSDLDYMGGQMALYAHSPVDDQDGRVGDLALARLYEAYGNITPATGKEKRRTWRYTATLLSLPSAGRNVIGNAAQGGVNAASHGVAQALDSLISLGTGKRTVAGLSVKERVDGWRAFAEETKNTFRDFYVDKAITSHGEDRHNLNQRGRVFQSDTLEALRLMEGYLMSVGDRNFWKKAYVNSLAEQQRVAEMNGEEFDYEAACERAEAEANYATFNEDSSVRDLLARLKNPPENAPRWRKVLAFGLDYLMPFTGIPTNITKRMLDYSPAGLAATMLDHGKRLMQGENFDQHSFVMEMSRGLTGTALFAIGSALFEAGLISLGTGEEEDKKIYGAETAQGRQYTPYIRIGDQYISLSTFMPAGSALIMGATARDIFKDDEDAWNAIKSACFSSFDMIFDASYMSALAEVFGGYGSLGENAVDSLMNSTVSMNVPAMLGQIASALDPYVRDTKDKNAIMQALKSGLIAKIPGLRNELLEAKVDITGEKVSNTKQYVAPIDPLTRTYANDDETLQYLIDFARETGDSSVIPELFVKSNKYEVNITKMQAESLHINRGKDENGKAGYQAMDIQVTDEEKWALNEEYGKAVFAEIRALMSNTRWKRWDAERRAEEINKVIKETKLDVLENFVKKRGIE